MPNKASGVQELYISLLFHQKMKLNEIWHFRSVCCAEKNVGFFATQEVKGRRKTNQLLDKVDHFTLI